LEETDLSDIPHDADAQDLLEETDEHAFFSDAEMQELLAGLQEKFDDDSAVTVSPSEADEQRSARRFCRRVRSGRSAARSHR
jgi:hypothetical protein